MDGSVEIVKVIPARKRMKILEKKNESSEVIVIAVFIEMVVDLNGLFVFGRFWIQV